MDNVWLEHVSADKPSTNSSNPLGVTPQPKKVEWKISSRPLTADLFDSLF